MVRACRAYRCPSDLTEDDGEPSEFADADMVSLDVAGVSWAEEFMEVWDERPDGDCNECDARMGARMVRVDASHGTTRTSAIAADYGLLRTVASGDVSAGATLVVL